VVTSELKVTKVLVEMLYGNQFEKLWKSIYGVIFKEF
jgi:hypothetical protein